MQHSSSLFFILFFLLTVMVGEYVVYVFIDLQQVLESGSIGTVVLLKLIGKGGLWCRLAFVLCYPLWVLLSPNSAVDGEKRESWPLISTLVIAGFLFSSWLLITIQHSPFLSILYPLSFTGVVMSGMLIPLLVSFKKTQKFGIRNEKRKLETPYSFNFQSRDGWINVVNPFRGVFISGAAGAGKSESLGYPIIHQAVQKGYTGLVYDFKFPVLAEQVHKALWESGRADISYYLLNFHDLSRSHRVNPIKADQMPLMAYAEEYSLAILHNLWPETIRKKDFWVRSASAILTAVIWFLKKHHPECCTIPHAVNIVLYKDYLRTMSMLTTDPETEGLVQSLVSAIENEAEGQIAGVMGSLQLSMARINSPEICWVLSGDDLDLDLNNPVKPKIVAIGADASLVDTFSPLISCIITVALKLMNRAAKLPSIVLLDEAPTLYIPKLEMIPATARSNKVAVVYMAQDYSQMVDSYGKEKADVMMANLNNQFFGRVSGAGSAKMISEFFGREEKEVESRSITQSFWGSRQSNNQSVSLHKQEKQLVRPQDLTSLQVGEFVGTTVEGGEPYFWSKVKLDNAAEENFPIMPFAQNVQVQKNFEKIRAEAEMIVGAYECRLRKAGRRKGR